MAPSVTAFVFMTVSSTKISDTLEKLKASHIVESAYAVTGPYDIIATVKAEDVDALGQLVTKAIREIKGIERTLTSIILY